MTDIRFLPYERAHEIAADDLIVCDCYYHRGLNLTHLYSERVPPRYRANTSTETVLNWLADESAVKPGASARFVTCNHWDIDGMLSVWSVLNPDLALANRELLVAAAHLGDFREFDHRTTLGMQALRLCCILNRVEADEFCLPFGDLNDATMEFEVSAKKFEYFLPRFADWLRDPDAFVPLWRPEYDDVMRDIAAIEAGEVAIDEIVAPAISVVKTRRPLHYYAIFSHVRGGAVLTEISEPHYIEFEYRYETAVGRNDKTVMERCDLSDVATALNRNESAPGACWVFDNINEGGSMLRPEYSDKPLSREDRYQSLGYRLKNGFAPSTTIDAAAVLTLISQEYEKQKERTPTVYAP